jgi:acetyl esterase/lipase
MRFRLAATAVTFGLLVAACSGADESTPAAEPVTSTTSTTTTSAPSTTSTTNTSSTSTTAAPTTTTTAAPLVDGVSAEPIFEVDQTTGIVYAQALSHAEWRSEEAEVIDLTLDVFEPVGAPDTPRPALMMIHGGGFINGNSSVAPMTNMATYFASRGWIAFSINYRLAGDHGTLPSFFPEVDDPDPRRVEQIYAIYTACRDAKAAIRRIRANAETYGIDTERITASGGSAGSTTAVGLGVVDESDCKDELTVDDDPTLATTNPGESSEIHTIIDHWGSAAMVLVVEALNGGDSRFDATDAPISIVHGTADPTVTFDKAEQLEAAYAETGVPYAYHPLPGAGHGAWQYVLDGKSLFELAFDFIVEQQELSVR